MIKKGRGKGAISPAKKSKVKAKRYAGGGESDSDYGESLGYDWADYDRTAINEGGGGGVEPLRFNLEPPSAAQRIMSSVPAALQNIRFGDRMLGYQFPIGKDSSITPYVGRGRAGINATIGFKKGGKVSSASKRADGCCQRGKTKGKMV